MAVGAQPGHVLGMVLREGMSLVLRGMVIGLVVAFAVTRLLSRFLYGISPADPATFAGISLFLAAVTLAATFVPARRAAQVDPIVALRYE